MVSAKDKNPLRELTPTESDLDDNSNNSSSSSSSSAQTSSNSGKQGETLREKATKKLNGPNANPSQLGDPISLKAETSDNVPTPDEEGARKGKGTSRL